MNVTMTLGYLLLGLLVAGSHAGSEPECGEREEQELQSKVSGCLASATFQFEDRRDAAREVEQVREAACLLVVQAVDECGSMWGQCHSGEEVNISHHHHHHHHHHNYHHHHQCGGSGPVERR